MINNPKISVIIPVYNAEKYLNKCIDSVLNQTYKNFEIILIDDKSNDKSGKICDDYSSKYDNVKVFHNDINCLGGVSYNRNLGLKTAVGELIYFLDSDDFIDNNLFEDAVEHIYNDNLDMFIFRFKIFENDDEPLSIINEDDKLIYYNAVSALSEMMKGGKFRGSSWNKICKKNLYKNVSFPEGRKYGEDIYVTYRLISNATKIGFTNKYYYFYRMHTNSAMNCIKDESLFERVVGYEELIQFVEINFPELIDDAYSAYCTSIIDTTVMSMNSINKQTTNKITKQISKSVVKHIRKIIFSNKIKISVKTIMILYAISNNLYCSILKLLKKL